MVRISEIGADIFVLASVFNGVNNEVLSVFIGAAGFVSVAESEKSTIFFLSQRYCFVS